MNTEHVNKLSRAIASNKSGIFIETMLTEPNADHMQKMKFHVVIVEITILVYNSCDFKHLIQGYEILNQIFRF